MTDTATERREQHLLLWVFWGGVVFAVVGETALFLLSGGGGGGAADVGISVYVTGTLSLIMLTLAALAYSKSVGGGGLATALICWMLVKSTAITGMVAYHLTHQFPVAVPYLILFVGGMVGFRPAVFLTDDG